MPVTQKDPLFFLVIAVLVVVLFAIDLSLPLGVGAGVFYVAVMLAAAWSPRRRFPLYVATGCSFLVVFGAFLSPPGLELWIAVVNRVLSLLAIWVIGFLAWFRRRAEERRLKEHRLLEGAYQDLDSFVRTLSHDLRGSLTPIIGYANLLYAEYGDCLGESGRNRLEEIENQGNRMLALMEDLLTLSRVGHLPPPEKPVMADEVVRVVLRNLEVSDGEEVRVAALPSLLVAETLLEQLFANLIGNALRYAGQNRLPIEVGGERQGGKVTFFVRDHGPGIPPAERQRVFEVFFRGSTGKDHPGTGVGLATVRKIARLFGGRAWVEETPGGGATFRVEMRDV
jgi:signal transduction histidine kinase